MFCTVADIRSLLPGVPAGEDVDELITRAIALAGTEILSRVGAYVDCNATPTPALIATLASYLGTSIYLLMSMSAGQETDPPVLSKHYRELAEKIIEGIIAGDPVFDNFGEQVGAGTGLKPLKSYTLGYLRRGR